MTELADIFNSEHNLLERPAVDNQGKDAAIRRLISEDLPQPGDEEWVAEVRNWWCDIRDSPPDFVHFALQRQHG